jgi:hypothetical protein
MARIVPFRQRTCRVDHEFRAQRMVLVIVIVPARWLLS